MPLFRIGTFAHACCICKANDSDRYLDAHPDRELEVVVRHAPDGVVRGSLPGQTGRAGHAEPGVRRSVRRPRGVERDRSCDEAALYGDIFRDELRVDGSNRNTSHRELDAFGGVRPFDDDLPRGEEKAYSLCESRGVGSTGLSPSVHRVRMVGVLPDGREVPSDELAPFPALKACATRVPALRRPGRAGGEHAGRDA